MKCCTPIGSHYKSKFTNYSLTLSVYQLLKGEMNTFLGKIHTVEICRMIINK